MGKYTIWIDLTMLAHWQGQLTGIQRVEYNLAKRFARKPYTRFCIFDKSNRHFLEYDFSLIETKISGLQTDRNLLEESSESISISLKTKMAAHMPAKLKRPIKAGLQLAKKGTRPVPSARIIKFSPADKLLILSGDWSDGIFYSTLTAMKKNVDFRVIQIVYDLLPAVQPSFFVPGMPEQVRRYMGAIFAMADYILTISKATKKDIELFQQVHDLPRCPVKIIRLGEDFAASHPLKPNLAVKPGGFLLCVGTVEARKNHMALYYTVREAVARGIELPPIVIAGKIGWLADDFLYLVRNDPNISRKIILLNNGTDREISWLFQNCKFSLYPSFYEGWGLPIAESLFYEKLCLASDSSSMPEIASDLIDYFSPNDPKKVLELIVKYLDNPKLLKAKEEQIAKDYHPTSWDDTFKQVEKILLDQ